MIQLCYNGDVCNHLPSHHPCILHRYTHINRLMLFVRKHETCAWWAAKWYKLFEMKQWPQRVWGQGSGGKNCKWHVHPGASSNKFLRRGWGPLISPLSSLTGLWGVICKYGSVMNLFSFSKASCCLLNHLCSTWATILSPTAALALTPKIHKVVLIVSRYRPAVQSSAELLTPWWFSSVVSFVDFKWCKLYYHNLSDDKMYWFFYLLLLNTEQTQLVINYFLPSIVNHDDVWHPVSLRFCIFLLSTCCLWTLL